MAPEWSVAELVFLEIIVVDASDFSEKGLDIKAVSEVAATF
jgi:hypothetical protein